MPAILPAMCMILQFDGVLENATQDTMYTTAAHEVVDSLLAGYSGCVLAYGQLCCTLCKMGVPDVLGGSCITGQWMAICTFNSFATKANFGPPLDR
eukprot:1144256-Pelagomonas_calceolata.AAC.1